MKLRWLKRGLVIATVALVAATLLGFIVMSLWNWLVPGIFGWHAITFWQALGLLILSKILFAGFHGTRGCGGHWKRRMSERWQQMTPEEREKFRAGIFSRCGHMGVATPESTASGEKI